MRLTLWTDYALRTLIFVGAKGGRLATIAEIAESFDIRGRRQAYQPAYRAAGGGSDCRGGVGAVPRHACRSAAAPPNDHRFPSPRLCGKHPPATLVQGAELAPARHGRRDGGGDGQGRSRRRDLRFAFPMYQYD